MMSTTWVDRLPAIATGAVASAAAVLAAVATRDVAIATGAVHDALLAWALPVIIEGAAAAAALLAWRRTRLGIDGAVPERTALLTLMVLAVAVNASHASGESRLGIVLAACPPLVVVGAVEMLLRARGVSVAVAERERAAEAAAARRERERERAERREREQPRAERPEQATTERPTPTPAPAPPRLASVTTTATLTPAQQVALVAERIAAGVEVREADLAAEWSISRATAGRRIRAARERAA